MNKKKIKSVIIMLLVFATGWTSGAISNGDTVNGLVTAMDAVLANLFGRTVAGVGIINPEVLTGTGVRFDFRKDTEIPLEVNVIYPPDPITPSHSCNIMLKLEVKEGDIHAIIDPDMFPAGAGFVVEESDGPIDPGLSPIVCEANS